MFSNIGNLVKWGINIINYLEDLEKEKIKGKQQLDYAQIECKLGWVKEYKESLMIGKEMLSITRGIEEKVKKEGISQEFNKQFPQNYQDKLQEKRINKFREKIEESLSKEIEMMGEDEIRIISSDVIESLFGKYKSFSQKSSLKEIRRMILTIPLSTIEITREFIKEALEKIKNIDVKDWEEKTFGKSMLSKRKIAFNF